MSKFWRIAKEEYHYNITQKQFLIGLFSLPGVFLIIIQFVAMFSAFSTDRIRSVGFLDQAGLLTSPLPDEVTRGYERPLRFVRFDTMEEAQTALKKGTVHTFFVVPQDYRITRKVEGVCIDTVSRKAFKQFRDWVRINLLKDAKESTAARIVAGSNTVYRLSDNSRELSGDLTLSHFLPLIAGFVFVALIFFSSGYMMQAVARERKNRMMEVLMTSVSDRQLMTGKIAGVVGVTVTLFAAWALFAGLVVIIGGRLMGVEQLQNLTMDKESFLIMAALLIPSYLMAATLMTTLGAMISNVHGNQAVLMMVISVSTLPGLLIFSLLQNPHGVLSVSLSVLPFTAPITLPFRLMIAEVPNWQIACSITIQFVCFLLVLWIGIKAFRIGRLRYGQPVRLKELFVKSAAKKREAF